MPTPTAAMIAPPSVTYPSDFVKLVSKNRQRNHARATSSKPTTIAAATSAAW